MNILIIEDNPMWAEIVRKGMPQGAIPISVARIADEKGKLVYATADGDRVKIHLPSLDAIIVNFRIREKTVSFLRLAMEWEKGGYRKPIFLFIANENDAGRAAEQARIAGVKLRTTILVKNQAGIGELFSALEKLARS